MNASVYAKASASSLRRWALLAGVCLAAALPLSASLANDDLLRTRAESGDAKAQFDFAMYLLGMEKRDDAINWLEKAAKGGHTQAQTMYYLMKDPNTLENATRAVSQVLPHSPPERAPSEHPSAANAMQVAQSNSRNAAWTGDLQLQGAFTKNVPLFRQSGNKVKLNLKQATSANNTRDRHENLRLTLRQNERGELTLQTGQCTGRLFARSGGDKNTPRQARHMRAYEVDYAVTRASPRCADSGRRKGEATTVYLANNNGGYDIHIHKTWGAEGNIEGRGELSGGGSLRELALPPPRVASHAPAARIHAVSSAPAQAQKSSLEGVPGIVDNALIAASRSWMQNRYDVGSVSGTEVLDSTTDGSPSRIYSNYTYNRGMRGWVRLSLADGQVQCAEFHDFPGDCRPLHSPGSGNIAIGVMGKLLEDAVFGGGTGTQGSSGTGKCRDIHTGYYNGTPVFQTKCD